MSVFKFGYWSTHDADGSRLYHEDKPEWWDRGFRKDEPNADGIGWCAKYPLSEPGTDPESADNFGPVAGTQEEALRAMEAEWLEWRADYVNKAEKDRATGVIRAEELTGGNRLLEAAQMALAFVTARDADSETAKELRAAITAAGGEVIDTPRREAKTGFKRAEPVQTVTRADLETVAAFGAELMENPKHTEFYERFADEMSGFAGFYQIAIDLAAPVNEAAKRDELFFESIPFYDLLDRLTNEYLTRSLEQGAPVSDTRGLFQRVHDEMRAEDAAASARVASWSSHEPAPKSAAQKNAPEIAQLVRADLIEAGQWLVGSSPDRNQFVQEVAHFTGGRVVLRTNYTGRTDEEPCGSSIMNGDDRLYVADSREAVRPKGPAQTTGAKL